MQYDLGIVYELCKDVGLNAFFNDPDQVVIELDEANKLCFYNFTEDDCLIGFLGVESHFHGDATFMGTNGYYIEVPYIDIITGLANGEILVCERWKNEAVEERYLVHAEYCGSFKYMDPSEIFILRCYKVKSDQKESAPNKRLWLQPRP